MPFHLPSLRKRKKQVEPNPLRLLPPGPISPRDLVLGTAQEMLGVKAIPGYDYALLAPHNSGNSDGQDGRGVVYHDAYVSFEQVLWYLHQVSVLILSEPMDLEPVMGSLDKAKEGQNRYYQGFIDSTKDWIVPNYDPRYDGRELHGRSIIYWGAAGSIFPEGSEETGSLYGTIPTHKQVGTVIHSVLNRLPVKFSNQRVDPILMAAPSEPKWVHDGYCIGDPPNRKFGFWKGSLDLDWLPGLMQLDVDIYLNVETETTNEADNAGNRLKKTYITVILRSSSEIDENGRAPKLEFLDRQLRYLGNWKRVTGHDVRVAFRAFVPGAPPIEEGWRWYRRSVLRARTLARQMVASVGTVSRAVRGTKMIGHRVEMVEVEKGKREPGRKLYPVILPKDLFIATAIVGPTGSGKTTLAAELALEDNTNVVIGQLSTAQGEGSMTWGPEFGGRLHVKNLPDAIHDDDIEREKLQRQLMQEDEKDAIQEAHRLGQIWQGAGQVIGLPLIIRPEVTSLRYYNWLRAFIKAFTAVWEKWNVYEEEVTLEDKTTRKVIRYRSSATIIIDDFSKWPGKASSLQYGKIPAEIGAEAHQLMQEAVGDFRKKGLRVVFTTHATDNFYVHSDGFLESCTMLVVIDLNEKTRRKIANFYNPAKEGEKVEGRRTYQLIEGNVEVTLDPALLNVLSRLEDR